MPHILATQFPVTPLNFNKYKNKNKREKKKNGDDSKYGADDDDDDDDDYGVYLTVAAP